MKKISIIRKPIVRAVVFGDSSTSQEKTKKIMHATCGFYRPNLCVLY